MYYPAPVGPSEDIDHESTPVPLRLENMTPYEVQRWLTQYGVSKPYFFFNHGNGLIVMKPCPFPFHQYACTHQGHILARNVFTYDPTREETRWDIYIPTFVNIKLSQFDPCVTLYSAEGEHVTFIVKYLLAWTFLPNPRNCVYVTTKNKSVIDIHLQNIRWSDTPDDEDQQSYINVNEVSAPLDISYPLHPVQRMYTK